STDIRPKLAQCCLIFILSARGDAFRTRSFHHGLRPHPHRPEARPQDLRRSLHDRAVRNRERSGRDLGPSGGAGRGRDQRLDQPLHQRRRPVGRVPHPAVQRPFRLARGGLRTRAGQEGGLGTLPRVSALAQRGRTPPRQRGAANMSSSNTAAPSLEGLVKSALHRSWWLLLLRGIAAVAFGVLTFIWPQISLVSLILVYGIYALVDGVLALIAAIRGGGFAPRWWLALGGVISILAAGVAFAWPGLTALVL